MPGRRVSLRTWLCKEILPVYGFIVVLCTIPGLLERYLCTSPITRVYIWTAIWSIAYLISSRFLVDDGPNPISTVGLSLSWKMLFDIYDSIGDPCGKTGVHDVGVEDVVYAGSFVLLVFGGASYLATLWSRPPSQTGEGESMEEKA